MDRITLHVTAEVYRLFMFRQKTDEYRPLNGYYFNLLDKFRVMKERCPNYLLECRIYEAYTKRFFTASVLTILIKDHCDVPQLVKDIYKDLPNDTCFYKLELLF